MQTVDDKTVISGLRWYTSDQYWLLITVSGVGGIGGVGGDFSQTGSPVVVGVVSVISYPQQVTLYLPGVCKLRWHCKLVMVWCGVYAAKHSDLVHFPTPLNDRACTANLPPAT